MEKFGITDEHLAKVKVTTSKHGAINPTARYKREFTPGGGPRLAMVSDPLRLYEICATSDGAGAVILCNAKKAKQFTSKPIAHHRVRPGQPAVRRPDRAHPRGELQPEDGMPIISESWVAAHPPSTTPAWARTTSTSSSCRTTARGTYFQYFETMDFCEEGTARLPRPRRDHDRRPLPVCPSGGFSSFGEATMAQGFAQLYEMVLQLRGVCGARQVEGAKVGMSEVYGAAGNNAAVILKK